MTATYLQRPGAYLFAAIGTGLVKIGYTECVLQRLTYGLRGPSGEKLAWLGDIRGGRNVENYLHGRFAAQRVWKRPEWFYMNDEIYELAEQARRDWRLSHSICYEQVRWDEDHWRGLKNAAWYFEWHSSRTPLHDRPAL